MKEGKRTIMAADERGSTQINRLSPIRVHPRSSAAGPVLAFFSLALLLCATLLPAEIIDQIAVTVDNRVITTSEIDEALRVAAFLNGEKPDLGGGQVGPPVSPLRKVREISELAADDGFHTVGGLLAAFLLDVPPDLYEIADCLWR